MGRGRPKGKKKGRPNLAIGGGCDKRTKKKEVKVRVPPEQTNIHPPNTVPGLMAPIVVCVKVSELRSGRASATGKTYDNLRGEVLSGGESCGGWWW